MAAGNVGLKAPAVGVVGASGAVGAELLAVMEQRGFTVRELRLLASPRSAGKQLSFAGETHTVQELGDDSFRGLDLVLFSAGSGTAREHAPRAVSSGAVVVDNSSAFRLDPDVPLVVPEINGDTIARHRGIVANPNCSTILLTMALAPLQRVSGLRRVVVSTYQAASGAGQRAMEEMRASVQALLQGEPFTPDVLPHSLALNLFPQVDLFTDEGYTREEDKMQWETRRILDLPELSVEATCVRVPVDRCHSESVTVDLDRPLTPGDARRAWADFPGVAVVDEPEAQRYPQPQDLSGRDEVAVGRVRPSRTFEGGLAFWVVGDQLRKGAALNAVQIAERLL